MLCIGRRELALEEEEAHRALKEAIVAGPFPLAMVGLAVGCSASFARATA
jgi:hypothetical protein